MALDDALETQDTEIDVDASVGVETNEVNDVPDMEDTIRKTLSNIKGRDEAGRFKSETVTEEPVKTETTETTETPETTETTETIDKNQLQRLGLRKEEMAAFEKADPVLKAAMLRRSDEMHNGVEQYRDSARFGQQVYKAIQPFEATIRAQGLSADEAIASLLSVEHRLRYGSPAEKQSQLAMIAESYGIDMANLFDAPQIDPQVLELKQEINNLRNQQQSWLASQQEAENRTILEQINAFSQGKEYFDQVKPEVAALLQAGRAKDLQEAYDMAIWARPDIRSRLLAKQQAEAEETRRAQAAAKVTAAKQAASVNVSTRGAMPSLAPVGTMEQTILDTYRKLTG